MSHIQRTKNAFFIEGGGTKGFFAIGVLKYLFEENEYVNLGNVDLFGGTSIGSYLACVLSLGYCKSELLKLTTTLDVSNLTDSKYLFFVTLARFMARGHFYSEECRETIIKQILQFRIDSINEHLSLETTINAIDLTFGHLRRLTELYPHIYKHLLINVVDISNNNQIFMTTLKPKWDNIKLYDALLAASSIPFVFKPTILYYYPSTRSYGYVKTDESTVNNLIDGGVSTINPLDFLLLNNDIFANYNLWLIKFRTYPDHVKINSNVKLLSQIMEFLISRKNDIKMDLIQKTYNINTINLDTKRKTLEIYTKAEIEQIIDDIYNQCISGTLRFNKE